MAKFSYKVEKKAESPIELILYYWFLQYGVFPELQYEISPHRVDFALPGIKTIIECDGVEFHGSKEQKDRDKQRDAFLENKGWKVLRFSGKEIYQNPSKIVKKVISLYYPPQTSNCCNDGLCDFHENEARNKSINSINNLSTNVSSDKTP